MAGCCRGRRKNTPPQSADCKTLEQAGSNLQLWPISTATGVTVTVRTSSRGYVEIGSFLQAFGCENSVSKMLLRYLPDINRVAQSNPSALRSFSRSGISLVKLLGLVSPPRRSQNHVPSQKRIR